MREMSASEASRNFSAVLDEAEHGGSIVVTRSGRQVALIVPAPRANGGALVEVFRRWSGDPGERDGAAGVDDGFARAVDDVRTGATADLDTDPWRD